MLSAHPGPLNPGATSPLSRHHLTRPSRAAGSFSGPKLSFAVSVQGPEAVIRRKLVLLRPAVARRAPSQGARVQEGMDEDTPRALSRRNYPREGDVSRSGSGGPAFIRPTPRPPTLGEGGVGFRA